MSDISQKIEEKIKDFLEKYDLLSHEKALLVGFSGGYDSICLLDILSKLENRYQFTLIAAHLNHNWRGKESDREEQVAKEFCLIRNIKFYSEKLSEKLPHTELEARNQRYEFFNRAAEKFNANTIITGHTATDNVETVLYRIIKGTGIKGLKGIPAVRLQDNGASIYRPMLEISREETIEYCKYNNLTVNVDSSNLDQKYSRNKIRLSFIPQLKEYNQEIEKAVLRLSSVANDEESIIEEYLDKIKQEIYKNDAILTHGFLGLSYAVKKRVILEFIIDNKIDYDYEKISEILQFIEENKDSNSGNTLSLTKNVWLFVSRKEIKIIKQIKSDVLKSTIMVNMEGETHHSELNKTLKITPWQGDIPDQFPKEIDNKVFVDLSDVKFPLYFRTRQAGDKIQPFGSNFKTKLKKYLINKGIPEFERDEIPLITTEDEILWVVSIGMSEILRVKNKPTHVLEIIERL